MILFLLAIVFSFHFFFFAFMLAFSQVFAHNCISVFSHAAADAFVSVFVCNTFFVFDTELLILLLLAATLAHSAALSATAVSIYASLPYIT